jgi:hypothetical protein
MFIPDVAPPASINGLPGPTSPAVTRLNGENRNYGVVAAVFEVVKNAVNATS